MAVRSLLVGRADPLSVPAQERGGRHGAATPGAPTGNNLGDRLAIYFGVGQAF